MRSRDNIKPVEIYMVQAQNLVREWTSEGLEIPVGKTLRIVSFWTNRQKYFTFLGSKQRA